MDYLQEYLSLVQSLKSYHAPIMELHLEVPKISNSNKNLSIENSPPINTEELSTLKKSGTQIDENSKDPMKISNFPSVSDNPFHTIIKQALHKHIFYEYPPVEISHTKQLPSHELPNVPLFFYKKIPSDQKFLYNLIAAIHNRFGVSCASIDAREIEEYNLWRSVTSMSHLHCIIVYDTWIANSPRGRCWYRAQTNTNNCFLGTIPLITLSSKEDFYRDIENKKVLWNQLCRILKKPFRKIIVK